MVLVPVLLAVLRGAPETVFRAALVGLSNGKVRGPRSSRTVAATGRARAPLHHRRRQDAAAP